MSQKGSEHKPRESLDEDIRLGRHNDGDIGMTVPWFPKIYQQEGGEREERGSILVTTAALSRNTSAR